MGEHDDEINNILSNTINCPLCKTRPMVELYSPGEHVKYGICCGNSLCSLGKILHHIKFFGNVKECIDGWNNLRHKVVSSIKGD